MRYDAAWVADEIEGDYDRFEYSFECMVAKLEQDPANSAETSVEYKALERARESLASVNARKNSDGWIAGPHGRRHET